MRAGETKVVSSAVLALALVALGCQRAPVQREVVAIGTPARVEGPVLVLLPRTCIVDWRAGLRHAPPAGPGVRTALELRRALDSMVPVMPRDAALPGESCKPPPDLSAHPSRLARLHASEHTIGLMRERGARHAVVIEIKATLSCVGGPSAALSDDHASARVGSIASYGIRGLDRSAVVSHETCDVHEIDLSAFVFRGDGAAVWAGTREVDPGERVEPAVERLLRRVPAALPARASRSGTSDMRCRLDDRGLVECT